MSLSANARKLFKSYFAQKEETKRLAAAAAEAAKEQSLSVQKERQLQNDILAELGLTNKEAGVTMPTEKIVDLGDRAYIVSAQSTFIREVKIER